MYDQTGSSEENPFSGFENEDIFNHFRGGFPGGRGQTHNLHPEDLESIFEDLFGGMGGGHGGSRRGRGRPGKNQDMHSEDIAIRVDL